MPTINFSLKDLNKLVGKKLKIAQLEDLVAYGKGELQSYDPDTDEVVVNFDDTNLPYLWSVEGIARMIKGVLGTAKGIPKLKINKSRYSIRVDKSVSKIRPYIAAFVAKGFKINDYTIKQMIQLQEKLCESYGRKRQKVAIGVYSYDAIKFPIHYKATDPESITFIPLEFRKEMTQQEILEEHPKGREYAWILKDFKKYPILIDSNDRVLSFPPIINSNESGKIEPGNDSLFVEVTGTDLDSVNLSLNILAQAFFERGFKIFSVDVKYPHKKITTPHQFNESIRIKKEQIKKLVGLDLKNTVIKRILEKAGYNFNNYRVKIPPYRKDILHPVDVIEDIAIMYGYDRIEEAPLVSYTIGATSTLVKFIDKVREIVVGLGFQEVMSPILTNKLFLYDRMNITAFGTVEIQDCVSETYSVVRTWLLPTLLEVLSKNKHASYPQKIFEQGLITVKKKEPVDYERIAVVSAHDTADYTEIKQILDYLFRSLGVKYEIEETEHGSFIEGRVGRVIVNGVKVAYLGEISPIVLENWQLEVPAVGLELNLTALFDAVKK
jgi:phenylalanyl-tRNA synthetase beta chain